MVVMSRCVHQFKTIVDIPLLKSSRTASSRSGFIDSDVHSAIQFNEAARTMYLKKLLQRIGSVDWLESGIRCDVRFEKDLRKATQILSRMSLYLN